ncbi:MAG: ABC-2 family transporter protein [Chloroflexota bacterium]
MNAAAATLSTVARYQRVHLACLRNCLARELEYRASFIIKMLAATAWSLLSLLFTGLVFGNVREIEGWDMNRMLVLMGTFLVVDYLASAFVLANMTQLTRLVNQGELDFILIRPISSQFLVSCRRVDYTDVPGAFVGAAYVLGGIARLGVRPDLEQIAGYVGLIAIALVTVYSGWFLTTTLVLYAGRINNIAFLFLPITDLGRMPTDVFKGVLRGIFTFLLPVAIIGTVPASVLLGTMSAEVLLVHGAIAVALLVLSSRFWTYSLRRYTSASS